VKVLIRWTALALLVLTVLVFARHPFFWQHYFVALTPGEATPVYQPRELVPGGNQPPAPRESPASESLDINGLEQAADYAGTHQSRALIVSRHGYIVFERYWQGTRYDTVSDSKGLARILTALATGAAISARKIGWPDEPIGYFISAWRDDPRGRITIRNLLQLSSGLAGSTAPPLRTDIIADYLQRAAVAQPGTRWVDQSSDPELLAHVIELATRQRYAQFISQSVWRRIGAGDAWVWLDHPGGAAHVDEGFLAQQGDWIRVGELLLTGGKYQGAEVIVPRWMPEIMQPAAANGNYGAYVHLGAHPTPGVTPYVTGEVFAVEGGGNRLWLIPSLEIAILRMGARTQNWDEASIPNLIIRAARDFVPPAARPGADLRQLVPNH